MRMLIIAAAMLAGGAAFGQSITVEAVKAQLVLENTGALSENIVGSKKKFHNTVSGGGEAGEPSNSILVTFVFKGPSGQKSSDKIARDLANVTITQRGAKTKVLVKRVLGSFAFSPQGLTYRAVLLEDATCAPLEIDVKIARSQKTERIAFSCDEPKV